MTTAAVVPLANWRFAPGARDEPRFGSRARVSAKRSRLLVSETGRPRLVTQLLLNGSFGR